MNKSQTNLASDFEDSEEPLNGFERMFIEQNVPMMMEKMNWKPFESILDYGCGSGSVTSEFLFPVAEKYSSVVTGVDLCKEKIELAHARHLHVLCNYLEGDIMTEDIFKYPLQNVKFDKILCIHVLHLIPNYEEFFNRLYNHMNKSGQLAIGVYYSQMLKIHSNLCEHAKWRKYMTPMKKFRAPWTWDDSLDFPNSIKSLIDSLGLKINDFSPCDTKYSFQNVNALADSILASNLGTKNVPMELQDELKEEICEQASNIFGIPMNSKPFTITLKYLRLVVEK